MKRIHFIDDGQDILWWDIDEKGVVQDCNLQVDVWKGTIVQMTDKATGIDDIQPGDKLACTFPHHTENNLPGVGMFIHPVEKVEERNVDATPNLPG
jgi:hypothetical protein